MSELDAGQTVAPQQGDAVFPGNWRGLKILFMLLLLFFAATTAVWLNTELRHPPLQQSLQQQSPAPFLMNLVTGSPYGYPVAYLDIVEHRRFALWLSSALLLMIAAIDLFSAGWIYRLTMRTWGVLQMRPTVAIACSAVLSFLAISFVALVGLRAFPNSADEYVYTYQADTYLAGRFWNSAHPLEEYFAFCHIGTRDGKTFGRFPPGYPALLALGKIFHIPYWLLNPVTATATLLLLYHYVRRFYSREAAMVTVIATGTSAYFVLNSASYFSHTTCAFFILLYAWFGMRYLQADGRWWHAFLAGAALGAAFDIRYYTAVIAGTPFAVQSIFVKRKRARSGLTSFGLGVVPFLGMMLWYNGHVSGNPFLLPTTYFDSEEGLGFIKGHTLIAGVRFAVAHLLRLAVYGPPTLLAVLAYVVISRRRRVPLNFPDWFLPLLAVAYLFYWHNGGNQYGPRFYYESYVFAIVLPAACLYSPGGWRSDPQVLRYVFTIGVIAYSGEIAQRIRRNPRRDSGGAQASERSDARRVIISFWGAYLSRLSFSSAWILP